MQLSEVITYVQRLFGDENEIQIQVDDIITWADEGQKEIARQTECLQKEAVFDYNPVGFTGFQLPLDFISAKRVTYEGLPLRQTIITDLDNIGIEVDNSDATGISPTMYYFWGNKISIFPEPRLASVQKFKLFYVALPPQLNQISDALTIPSNMHNDVRRFVLMRARELNEDSNEVSRIEQQLSARMADSKYEMWNPSSNTYPSVRPYD